MKSVTKVLCSTAVTGLLLLGSYAATARAEQFVSSGWKMSAHAAGHFAFDCQNSPGPTISLPDGTITLGAVGYEITLANQQIQKGPAHITSPGDIVAEGAVLLDFGTQVQIPKQPSRPANYYGNNFTGTGVGGNPWIYVQFYDQNGNLITPKPILLGRCVQGAAAFDYAFLEAVIASAHIGADTDTCSNNPGAFIYINDGLLSLSGVTALVTFTNNAKWTHVAQGDAQVSFDVIGKGAYIAWPKQPPLGGVGGNPYVYFIFEDDDNYVGTWPGYYLGRCNKI